MKGIFTLLVLLATLLPASLPAAERRSPVVAAIEKAGPAVVNIRTEQIVKRRRAPVFGFGDSIFDEFFRSFAAPQVYKTQSLGSGVIVDRRGYVLTNAHVIEQASKIFVAVPGQTRELAGELVGSDERLDLAVVRIQGEGDFPFLAPGRSDDLLLGETVIAIGNPLGLGHSVTTGVVSAASRRLPMDDGVVGHFIQTDALINPGNSGGPLLNINGELIGINTAIARQAQGIGFSIPIDLARRVAGDLIKHGQRRPVWLGLLPGSVNVALTRSRGAGGVLVTEVDPGSPAAKAGVELADVILGIDGLEVESPAEMLQLLSSYTPEDQLRLRLLRGDQEQEVTVVLAPLPPEYGLRYVERIFGFRVREGSRGLVIAAVTAGSPAQQAGLQVGDVVAEVGGQRFSGAREFGAYFEAHLGELPQSFLFGRGDRGAYIDLP
ncbi:trypsin-like peptidase domain-containing protein [Desulfuromonas carbonis]